MTHGERVKAVRTSLHLTLEKFGEKLGVGKTAISNIEKGNRSLTEQMTRAICREYNVNYSWLTAEEGEMFRASANSALDALVEEYHLTPAMRLLFEKFLNLKPELWKLVFDFARDLSSFLQSEESSSKSSQPTNLHKPEKEAAAKSETSQPGA